MARPQAACYMKGSDAHPPQLSRQCAQGVNDSIPLGPLGNGVLAQSQGHHSDDNHLACVSLGGGNSYFTAGIDVHTTVCVACNGTAHCVCDANAQSSPILGVVQSLSKAGTSLSTDSM